MASGADGVNRTDGFGWRRCIILSYATSVFFNMNQMPKRKKKKKLILFVRLESFSFMLYIFTVIPPANSWAPSHLLTVHCYGCVFGCVYLGCACTFRVSFVLIVYLQYHYYHHYYHIIIFFFKGGA